jgi:hypothetical protein
MNAETERLAASVASTVFLIGGFAWKLTAGLSILQVVLKRCLYQNAFLVVLPLPDPVPVRDKKLFLI